MHYVCSHARGRIESPPQLRTTSVVPLSFRDVEQARWLVGVGYVQGDFVKKEHLSARDIIFKQDGDFIRVLCMYEVALCPCSPTKVLAFRPNEGARASKPGCSCIAQITSWLFIACASLAHACDVPSRTLIRDNNPLENDTTERYLKAITKQTDSLVWFWVDMYVDEKLCVSQSQLRLFLTGHVIVTAHPFPSRHLDAPRPTFPLSSRGTAATTATVALP